MPKDYGARERRSSRSPRFHERRSSDRNERFSTSNSRSSDRAHRKDTRPQGRSERERERVRDEHRQEHHRRRWRERSGSRSESPDRHNRSKRKRSRSPVGDVRDRKALPSQGDAYRAQNGSDQVGDEREKPNFKPTGLLAAETNRVTHGTGKDAKSIVLKYHEPPEARRPPSSETWSLFVFKGSTTLQNLPLHERTCWLFGRETAVVDVLLEESGCSKQHAVCQFRYTTKKDEWGEKLEKVALYILDLESTNGTFLNGNRLEPARYYELKTSDIITFGDGTRDYVVMQDVDERP